MEICKNKSSNKYFIYIEKTGKDEALLITPEAEVKNLKIDLFDEIEEEDENYLLENKLVTEAQVKRFNEYNNSRKDESFEWFEDLSADEQEIFIKRLQEMTNKK